MPGTTSLDGRHGGRRGLRMLVGEAGLARLLDRRLRLALGEHEVERLLKLVLGLAQRDAVLRALRAREARLDGRQIELERRGVGGIRRVVQAEQALLLRVGLDQLHVAFFAPRQTQVVERHLVDRADRDRRPVFRRHVAERRAIGNRQELQPRPVELHELADDPELAEPLRDREHEIGRRRAFGQPIGEAEADDFRNEHRDRLAEHRGLGLDAADAPAHDAEPVDHRGVRVGADERVRVGEDGAARLLLEDHAREVLEVDLVHDAGVGRHHAEVLERLLPPAEERVALLVAAELERGVEVGGVDLAIVIDLHRVIDDELDRLQRVDLLRVAAEPHDAVAHRGEIDDRRHAGEVLQQHARRGERDLRLLAGLHVPPGQRLNVVRIDEPGVLAAQQVLEQDLEGIRQPRQPAAARPFERRQAEELDRLATRRQPGARVERIVGRHHSIISS